MATNEIKLFTIGFAGKSAEQFFTTLRQHNVRRVIDVRLFNRSQLAGFTKQDDLEFFLREILNAAYLHLAVFTPTKSLLEGYRRGRISWGDYEQQYKALLEQRQPQQGVTPEELDHACLLCSEADASQCHRRLAAEHLQRIWPQIRIQHL